MTKDKLRKKYIEKRIALSAQEVLQKSSAIFKNLQKIEKLHGIKSASVYIAFGNEVDTTSIVKKLNTDGVSVHVPKYLRGKWTLGKKGFDIAILPGVAFDTRGVRLGYGKGVYDKLLAKSRAIKIGLAYDFQITDKLPKEKHDLVMDYVVTEKRII